MFTPRTFVYATENIEREIPTTATMLVAYLYYISRGGKKDFVSYVNNKLWGKDTYIRWLVLLAAVSDNLWQLSKQLGASKLRDWIKNYNLNESGLIKISMAISILLGRETNRLNGLLPFFDLSNKFDDEIEFNDYYFEQMLAPLSQQIDNMFNFVKRLDAEISNFIMETQASIADDLLQVEAELERVEKRVKEYVKAMPIRLRTMDKAAVMHMLQTIGDKTRGESKQVEFYGAELDRLQIKITNLINKSRWLQEKKELVAPEQIKGIALFMPKQCSEQVKGILSSLLYYFGRKNIVIEEDEFVSFWGSRGFTKDILENELTTLKFDKRALDIYLNYEESLRNLPPSLRRPLNISHNVTIEEEYIGGSGGRGRAFGGNIKGRVPQLFAILEATELRNKVQDLIRHGELGKALRGLTEGEAQVPTTSAIRTKLKTRGWITVKLSNDILSDEKRIAVVWLAGHSKRLCL
jgi:phage host-nuclease inhibitor protein Gam